MCVRQAGRDFHFCAVYQRENSTILKYPLCSVLGKISTQRVGRVCRTLRISRPLATQQ